jgi:hypothetical protein
MFLVSQIPIYTIGTAFMERGLPAFPHAVPFRALVENELINGPLPNGTSAIDDWLKHENIYMNNPAHYENIFAVGPYDKPDTPRRFGNCKSLPPSQQIGLRVTGLVDGNHLLGVESSSSVLVDIWVFKVKDSETSHLGLVKKAQYSDDSIFSPLLQSLDDTKRSLLFAQKQYEATLDNLVKLKEHVGADEENPEPVNYQRYQDLSTVLSDFEESKQNVSTVNEHFVASTERLFQTLSIAAPPTIKV